MALDPSIILQAGRGVTPLMSQAEIQDQQMQRELGGMKLAQMRQAMQDDQSMRDIARSTGANDLAGAYYKAGLVKPAQEAQKFQTDQQKSQRDAEKSKLEAAMKQFEIVGQVLGGVRDQASYDAGRQQLQQFGIPTPNAPPQYDPAAVQQFSQQAMSAKDRMEQQYKALTFSETQRHNQATEGNSLANNAATNATAQRGQDLADKRAREQATAGKVPGGYRLASDGVSLEFIPGGPADPASKAGGGKPLTEGQSKALLFGTRMKEANETLEGLASKGVDRPSNWKRAADSVPNALGGQLLQTGANAVQSDAQQQVEQAQRDFLNAVLRRESGAVISEQEFDNGRKQYFPQIGDSDAVKEQKKRNREVAMRGILEEVPEGDARVEKIRGPKQEAPGAPVNVANAADYAKVPSGATYTTPDGKTRRKP